jgi:hypothetical protein
MIGLWIKSVKIRILKQKKQKTLWISNKFCEDKKRASVMQQSDKGIGILKKAMKHFCYQCFLDEYQAIGILLSLQQHHKQVQS